MKLFRKKITLTLDSVAHPGDDWIKKFLRSEVSQLLIKKLGRYFVIRNVTIEDIDKKNS